MRCGRFVKLADGTWLVGESRRRLDGRTGASARCLTRVDSSAPAGHHRVAERADGNAQRERALGGRIRI